MNDLWLWGRVLDLPLRPHAWVWRTFVRGIFVLAECMLLGRFYFCIVLVSARDQSSARKGGSPSIWHRFVGAVRESPSDQTLLTAGSQDESRRDAIHKPPHSERGVHGERGFTEWRQDAGGASSRALFAGGDSGFCEGRGSGRSRCGAFSCA